MNKDTIKIADETARLAGAIRKAQTNVRQEGGWVVQSGGGHTPETYNCPEVRTGRETAVGYVLNRLSGSDSDEQDLQLLESLVSLVDGDQESATHGCMRWFAEETRVSDTNAAFFALLPLAVLELCQPDLLPGEHSARVHELLSGTTPWFRAECAAPRLYYPNKTISDGAMLLAAGSVLGDQALIDEALAYLWRWVEYTIERGWGWGENISLGYQRVILVSLQLASRLASTHDQKLASKLAEYQREILTEAAFHDGAEFVPSIRSYNFSGQAKEGALPYALIGHPESDFATLVTRSGQAWAKVIMLLLFPAELSSSTYATPKVPRSRTRRVFDGSSATSWVGDGVRLGTVSRFPVMPDHYQQRGWGLGWQSFPVSALVDSCGVSTLLWYAKQGEEETTHPYYGEGGLQRNYVLAGKPPYPAIATHAFQRDGTAVVVRTISRIHDDPVELGDQWLFRNCGDSIHEHDDWFIQYTDGTALAVRPLGAFRTGSSTLEPPEPVLITLDNDRAVRVVLHSSGSEPLAADRLEIAWAIVARDGLASIDELKTALSGVQIHDEANYSYTVPRMNYAYTRCVSLAFADGGESDTISLSVDYHYDLWR